MKPYIGAIVLRSERLGVEPDPGIVTHVNPDGTVNIKVFHSSGHIAPFDNVAFGPDAKQWQWPNVPPASAEPPAPELTEGN